MAYIGKSPDGTGVRARYYFTATGGETSLSGADDNAVTLSFADGAYVDVYLNGVLLVAGTDYNTTTANTISGLTALAANDIVEILVYDIFTVADTVSASAGGTFSGNVTVNALLNVDNIRIDGNTISSTDTNGDIVMSPNGTGVVTGDFNDNRQCVMGFMLTSGVSATQTPITGWVDMATQLSGEQVGKITRGGSVTESSGVFSFPFTGLWQVEFYASATSSAADATIEYNIRSSLTGGAGMSTIAQAKESHSSSTYKASVSLKTLFNCADTANHVVDFAQQSFANSTTEAATGQAITYVIFTWLGDAS